ncbi:hypothetical protein SEPCBS119000_003656 [Sporothrix epigloea]|uniref:Uncharacterized protein n=1 Tax=Sporothrix epigloea TaxID=1892477 RepID=A0ABP0DPU1_9PEZI
MFVPSVSGVLPAPTGKATAVPGVINSMAITNTNNPTLNNLTIFLFFFFLCSTVVLVVASVVFLRRLKRRAADTASQASQAEKYDKAALAAGKDVDEASIGGSFVKLVRLEASDHCRAAPK